MPSCPRIRPARPEDAKIIWTLIRELAEYEQLLHIFEATEQQLAAGLFGPDACAESLIAELDGQPVGCAIFLRNLSTFSGRPGLYVEDLYVRPAFRGRGIGKSLLAEIARIALDRNYARLEWAALDWNAPAIRFYKKIGSKLRDEWRLFRLSGAALEEFARCSPNN